MRSSRDVLERWKSEIEAELVSAETDRKDLAAAEAELSQAERSYEAAIEECRELRLAVTRGVDNATINREIASPLYRRLTDECNEILGSAGSAVAEARQKVATVRTRIADGQLDLALRQINIALAPAPPSAQRFEPVKRPGSATVPYDVIEVAADV